MKRKAENYGKFWEVILKYCSSLHHKMIIRHQEINLYIIHKSIINSSHLKVVSPNPFLVDAIIHRHPRCILLKKVCQIRIGKSVKIKCSNKPMAFCGNNNDE